jgi:hypothetical protein
LASALPAGPCPRDAPIVACLLRAWPQLHGAAASEMTRERLASGIVDIEWSPSILSFDVREESRSLSWQVDVQDATTWRPRVRRIALPPKEDACVLARALAAQVVAGVGSLAVVRKSTGGITIRPGEVPGLDVGFAETLPGRHARFRAALDRAMAEAGFANLGPYRFRRLPPD